MRLDQYMAQYWPEYSRSSWQKFIALGYVSVNGTVQTSAKLALGEDDEVSANLPPEPNFSERTLPIIYEDEHVIVINKPSGVLTHAKGELSNEFTLADFVRPKQNEPDETNRPGIVHRLDRATSGVIIAAKDHATKRLLQKQFQDRKVKKSYIAIVRGKPKLSEANLDLPIGRDPKQPSRFRVDPSGKASQTHYEVIVSGNVFSVLRLRPTTGRTHQLRVHLAYIGTPIAGDDLYRGGRSPIGRLCLHAESLEITIPTSRRMTFTAPLDDDFQKAVDAVTG